MGNPMTMQLGEGLGPYRLGMHRRAFPGLLKTIRQPMNDSGGCIGGFKLDSYIDVYPGLRLGYIVGREGKTFLNTIETTRPGDRTSLGFTIRRSTIRDVRRRYPHARVTRHSGGSTLAIFRDTGYESGEDLWYSFNAAGLLVGLGTDITGC